MIDSLPFLLVARQMWTVSLEISGGKVVAYTAFQTFANNAYLCAIAGRDAFGRISDYFSID